MNDVLPLPEQASTGSGKGTHDRRTRFPPGLSVGQPDSLAAQGPARAASKCLRVTAVH